MEILRVPPYPLVSTWDVPDSETSYVLELEDLVDHSIESTDVVSNSDSQIVYELPQSKVQFDRNFAIRIYDSNSLAVVDSNLNIYRPYVDPNSLGTTASEIEEYKMLEIVSRAIIDEFTNDGFYNHKLIVQGVGTGTDYYPVWHESNRVLKVYENDVLVYDIDAENPEDNIAEYKISLDNSAIYKTYEDTVNRRESAPIKLPASRGDIWTGTAFGTSFPAGFDYTFVLDAGHKAIPPEIEYAAKLLIDDIKCGRLDYYKRYMSSYSTDQFKIGFTDRMFDGTGNMIVDKILGKYVKSIQRLGVL